jgi:hypothetical protein
MAQCDSNGYELQCSTYGELRNRSTLFEIAATFAHKLSSMSPGRHAIKANSNIRHLTDIAIETGLNETLILNWLLACHPHSTR